MIVAVAVVAIVVLALTHRDTLVRGLKTGSIRLHYVDAVFFPHISVVLIYSVVTGQTPLSCCCCSHINPWPSHGLLGHRAGSNNCCTRCL